MKKAIEKLKQLAEDNIKFADQLEASEFDFPDKPPVERVESLIRTYRYWSQCLLMAAWLLDNDEASK